MGADTESQHLWPVGCLQGGLPSYEEAEERQDSQPFLRVVWAKVPGLIHYTTSKGAIVALTHGLAGEWGKYGINVNAIAPGYTMTEASLKLAEQEPKSKEIVIGKQCIPRLSEPEDMVGAAIFLASDDSDMVTGQNISVDGGQCLR
jgi:NAD(P)-dependent dehydrogenase (short-subunit alcohol dehydrogenase family)